MEEKNPIVLCAEGFVLASMFFLLTFMIAPPILGWHQEAHRISVSLDTDSDGIANIYDATPYGAMRAQFGTMGKPFPAQSGKCHDRIDSDNDGMVDERDGIGVDDCDTVKNGQGAGVPTQSVNQCNDHIDNDNDGMVDERDGIGVDACDTVKNGQGAGGPARPGMMRPSAPTGAVNIKGFWQSVVKYFQGFDVTVGSVQESIV